MALAQTHTQIRPTHAPSRSSRVQAGRRTTPALVPVLASHREQDGPAAPSAADGWWGWFTTRGLAITGALIGHTE